jgi:type III secretion protein Y
MATAEQSTVELLHALGYLYGQHGQTKRGLVLLLIAARLDPDDVGVLRTLAHTFVLDSAPDRAVAVLDRLRTMEDADHPVLDLLTARALWVGGSENEARRSFRNFLMNRRRP